MSDAERVIPLASLSESAWSRVQGSFFSPGFEGSTQPSEVIAGDGALWRHYYFETPVGVALSLVRETDEAVISYALEPTTREIAFVSINRRSSFMDKISDISFQTETGMTIPTGDDLQPLEAFLLP